MYKNITLLRCASLQLIQVFYGSVQTANGALPPPTDSEFEVLLQYEASPSFFNTFSLSYNPKKMYY